MSKVIGYRSGQYRNEPRALSHTYAMTAAGWLWPMCGYGWNRSGGHRLSIFRGAPGTHGLQALRPQRRGRSTAGPQGFSLTRRSGFEND